MDTQAMQCARSPVRLSVIRGDASGGGAPVVETDFLMTVRTTGASETFTITCFNSGTFNATIDWGDAGPTSTITAYNDADLAHTYATAGDYQIRVSGTFPRIRMGSAALANREKIISVDNLGSVGWVSFYSAFANCINMTSFTAGDCDTASAVLIGEMFRGCTSLTSVDLAGFDSSAVTGANSMTRMFADCTSLTTLDLSMLDTSGVSDMIFAFGNAALTSDPGLVSFNVGAVTTAFDMCFGANAMLSTAEYDAILIAWAPQITTGFNVHFGDATYTDPGAAATARAAMVTAGCTITDGGPA